MDNKSVKMAEHPVAVLDWIGGAESGVLRLLDQTLLPGEVSFCECGTVGDVHDAIRRLVVRGAPAIGVAAAYGMVTALRDMAAGDAAAYLESSRPTAVNLSWAVRRIAAACGADGTPADALAEARRIHAEDRAMCDAIGRFAAPLVRRHAAGVGVLTHCNAGALATTGIGTATAGMYVAAAGGCDLTVYCSETRPLLQGSRLTAWELQRAGIRTVVITDNTAAALMGAGMVNMVIVGADRIAANGDTANKVGTCGLAILASHFDIPFYVAAPSSTFDRELAAGSAIPIEFRGDDEVTCGFGRRTAPEGVTVWSPAFDVTPAGLISGIVTDRGLIAPVNEEKIRSRLSGGQ